MRVLLIVLVLAGAAVAATFYRYESLHPCAWMEHDLAEETGLPRLAAQAQMRAIFLLEGVTNPNAQDCVFAWWRLRLDGAPQAQ